jgi:hypothetical protein
MSGELPAADGVSHILHLLHKMATTARTVWKSPFSRTVDGGRAQGARRLLRRLPSMFTVPLLHRILPEGPRRHARSDYVPSATDMKRMRVHFKKASVDPGKEPVAGIASVLGQVPLAVTLHENQLQLPQLRLEFLTAPLLLNLMAFEQSSEVSQDVSSYVAFMAKLVQSAEDARLLVEAEVVQQLGGLGNESMEEVARFFRVVGAASGATGELAGSYLRVTLGLLRSRSESWVDLERNYFTSSPFSPSSWPWSPSSPVSQP